MSKLTKKAKYRELTAIVKHAAGNEKIGSVGQKFVEYGGHAGLALASVTMEKGFFGIDMLRPDSIALAVAGAAYFFTRKKKGGLHKTSGNAARGAAHAIITRLVVKSRTLLVHGPDGWQFKHA